MAMSQSNKIDRKWVKEGNHVFSVYPSIQVLRSNGIMDEGAWLELAQFYHNDLIWLLSQDSHVFWSYMIYSDKVHQFLLSFLKDTPPNYLKQSMLLKEEMWKLQDEIEHLVFLVYARLCSKNEAIKNLGETLYNNYLFTVPVLLDICLIYGTSNQDLVKKMLHDVITLAPDFLNDLEEIVPHFFRVLRLAKDKFSVGHLLKITDKPELKSEEMKDFICYLHDSVATIEIFLQLYSRGCELFRKSEHLTEMVYFYSNVIPEIHSRVTKNYPELCELIDDTRIDMLKIVKNILDYVLGDKAEESVDDYLTLMMELLPEPVFLTDYNSMFSVEFEIESAVKNCRNVDTIKVKHILAGVNVTEGEGAKDHDVTVDGQVREVKDIFPDLENDFIKRCLYYYNNNTERVISAILENSLPSELKEPKTFKELLNDKEDLNELRDRYAKLSYVDDTYDDEYDDTYDENIDVTVKDTTEETRRQFVTPRVLREKEKDELEFESDEDEPEVNPNHFVENPEVVRERMEQKRRNKFDVVGRGRGQGQSRQVTRNREYKEAHKSKFANHNRKAQANRKLNRGMIPS